MSTSPKQFVSPSEYLERERKAENKAEYFAGEMFAMGEASRSHVRIVSNLVQILGPALRNTSCEVSSTDLKVFIPSTGLYTYPDVIVMCGPENFQGEEQDVLLNPLVIFEVLSSSTQSYDREHKFAMYRNIRSLQEYLTVAEDRQEIEQWVRRSDGDWVPALHAGSNATISMAAVDVSLALGEVYRNVTLPLGD
ncbi:MAG: Uma2 family endonuclease [Acidobacteriota bacterium]|nr:Uma2 family endonuclease [Acidobacteriota bacterium]